MQNLIAANNYRGWVKGKKPLTIWSAVLIKFGSSIVKSGYFYCWLWSYMDSKVQNKKSQPHLFKRTESPSLWTRQGLSLGDSHVHLLAISSSQAVYSNCTTNHMLYFILFSSDSTSQIVHFSVQFHHHPIPFSHHQTHWFQVFLQFPSYPVSMPPVIFPHLKAELSSLCHMSTTGHTLSPFPPIVTR